MDCRSMQGKQQQGQQHYHYIRGVGCICIHHTDLQTDDFSSVDSSVLPNLSRVSLEIERSPNPESLQQTPNVT